LQGTSYQVSDQSIENIKLGLSTFRLYSQKYDMHRGGSGRFPENINPLERLLPAYAYMGGVNGLDDQEVKGMFGRLWDRQHFSKNNALVRDFGRKGLGALGELEAILAAEAENAVPEPDLSGHWVFPYGALSVHRRPDWMAAAKGFSRYIWDYESSPQQNLFGGNASSGVLQLYTSGDPVNAFDSGFGIDGWDWHRLPGATTIRVPYDRMKTGHRNFSTQGFVGGLSAEGKNGIFAMRYENQVADIPLTANKSIFFFDDQIILLGSDIHGGDGHHAIETTLFQTRLPDLNDATHVNGEELTGLTGPVSNLSGMTWLTDAVGNGYVLPDGSALSYHRATQAAPDSRNRKVTSDLYATAWLSHGADAAGEGYEYVVLVSAGPERTESFAQNSDRHYRVIQKDGRAHIVQHIESGSTGYVFFESGGNLESSLITAVNQPVLIMTRRLDEQSVMLSVSNPDLALAPPEKTITARDLREDPHWLYHPSETPDVTLTLKGFWEASNLGNRTLTHREKAAGRVTELTFPSKHAQSHDVLLTHQR